jgi:hypothetical protein
MNRQPIYHEQSREYRVISAPNGLWQAQRHAPRGASQSSKECSGWVDLGRATSMDLAKRHIYTALPLVA